MAVLKLNMYNYNDPHFNYFLIIIILLKKISYEFLDF